MPVYGSDPGPCYSSYGLTYALYTQDAGYLGYRCTGVSLSALKTPAQDLYISEHWKPFPTGTELALINGQYDVCGNWTPYTWVGFGDTGSYHLDVVNALFVDGHVEGLRVEKLAGDGNLPPWSLTDWAPALLR